MSYPYPFIMIPDYISALIAYLRTQPKMLEVVAAERITMRVLDLTNEPTHNWLSIILIGGRDPFGAPPTLMYPHMSAHCQGTSGYESMRIWRTLKGVLEHPSIRMQGFVSSGCVFHDIRVGLPLESPELGTRTWDKRVAPIYATVSEVPMAVGGA